MKKSFKELINEYKHAVLLAYLLIYVPWFGFLNTWTPTRDPYPVYSVLDDMIPFCEWFAIPYFLWFAYIAIGYVFLMISSREDFVRMCIFLYTGMTICLIIYTVFPNCQELRVDYDTLERTNILIEMIRMMQGMDTPCNVLPSIHCLNSIGMHIALAKSQHLGKHRNKIVAGSFILMALIIMSTVFIKQHSILDCFASFIIAVPLYFLAYKPGLRFLKKNKTV